MSDKDELANTIGFWALMLTLTGSAIYCAVNDRIDIASTLGGVAVCAYLLRDY
jgi:hypothetical protein